MPPYNNIMSRYIKLLFLVIILLFCGCMYRGTFTAYTTGSGLTDARYAYSVSFKDLYNNTVVETNWIVLIYERYDPPRYKH